MPDSIVFTVAGIFTLICLSVGCIGVYFAMQSAKKNESELKMVFWSVVALAGLSFAGMCIAYFIIPIIVNKI